MARRFSPSYCLHNGSKAWPLGPFYGLCGRRWMDIVFYNSSWGLSRPRMYADIFGTRYGCSGDAASGAYVEQTYQLAKELYTASGHPGSCLPFYGIGTPYCHFKIDVIGAWLAGVWASSLELKFKYASPYVGSADFYSVASLVNSAPDDIRIGDAPDPYVCGNFTYGAGGSGTFCGGASPTAEMTLTVLDDGTFTFVRSV